MLQMTPAWFFFPFSRILSYTFFMLKIFSPWGEAPYKDAVERTALGGVSLSGFLSEVRTHTGQIYFNMHYR